MAIAILAGASSPDAAIVDGLPREVWLQVGTSRTVVSGLPGVISASANLPERRLPGGRLVLTARAAGAYHVTLRLAGIPVRRVQVEAVPPLAVVPGGQAIGVMLDTNGVLVVADAAPPSPAAAAGLRAGDLILSVDGQTLYSKEQLASIVQAAGRAGRALQLSVAGATGPRRLAVRPAWDGSLGRYVIGAWVRDGINGIGTLTFYDAARGVFAALGHVVADAAGHVYPVRDGRIVPAIVSGLQPGRQGDPGEKLGMLMRDAAAWGRIGLNTRVGVFGQLLRLPPTGPVARLIPIALEDQIRTGPAEMLTVIAGTRVQRFAIDIQRVVAQGRPEAKGLVLKVTDPRLLRETGGIVQGMSGSPILQGGRLIGAVTHVFVNDPTRGYGVLAIWMAEQAGLWHAGPAATGSGGVAVPAAATRPLRAAVASWLR